MHYCENFARSSLLIVLCRPLPDDQHVRMYASQKQLLQRQPTIRASYIQYTTVSTKIIASHEVAFSYAGRLYLHVENRIVIIAELY